MTGSAEFSTQKVPAIMFTDIAGFSRKLAENEVRAFELLKTHDALIRVLTAKFDGKVLKSLGDSFLVEFPNCVNAVKCAIEIQKRFWNFNRGKGETDTIRVRIGIHLSEITSRQGDIIGEDITIATRIEALTEPNRICITFDAYDKIKNLLPLNVFRIGKVDLKDISRKVEVYELLIDSIPELAQPSPTALQASSVQQDTIAAKREVEELKEATRIEEAKQRLIIDHARAEDDRNKKIALHYTRAETFFEVGELEKAEQELAEIARLDPMQRPPSDRQKKEKENERIVQSNMIKAREYFSAGNLEQAETEVNEIFRLLPLHTGAQQLLMQIEEERYKQDERKRSKKTESVAKQVSKDEQRIEELLNQAQALMHQEKFTEATFVLHDVFLIDPNHSGARRLEETIRQAKQARAELQRIEEEQIPEAPPPIQELESLKSKLEEKMKQKAPVHTPKRIQSVASSPGRKPLHILAYIFGSIIMLWVGIMALDWIFPKKASIAILRFTDGSNSNKDLDLFYALPVILADDFAKCEHLTVIAPTSSFLVNPDPALLQKSASVMDVEYFLLGTIREEDGRYTILLSLLIPDQEKIISVGTVEGTLSDLTRMRINIIEQVIDKIGIKSSIPRLSQLPNEDALENYIEGLHLMQLKSGLEVDSAKTLLHTAVELNPSFGLAYAALAEVELRRYNSMDAPQFLKSAAENAQLAIRYSPNDAIGYRVSGTYYRYIQNYDSALSCINISVTLNPQDPECYRELTFLSLIARKFDDAASYASNALVYDPKNPESYFTLGLVQHMKQNYKAAEDLYKQAQKPDESNSLLIAYYMQNAWIGQGDYEKVIRYCQQMLQANPDNYRYYYWISRAYQLSLQISTAQQWLEKSLVSVRQTIDDDPNDAIAHAYAGLIHSRLGQFSEGEAALNKALQLDNNSSEILFRFADLYSIQRNKQKAITALTRAVRRQYNFSELLNPDLSFISTDPEFINLITGRIEGKWPKK